MPVFTFEGQVHIKSRIHADNLKDAVLGLRKRHKGISNGMEVFYMDGAVYHEHTVNGFCDACDEPLLDEDYGEGFDCSLCKKCIAELSEAA